MADRKQPQGGREERVPRADHVNLDDLADEQLPPDRAEKLKGGGSKTGGSRDGFTEN